MILSKRSSDENKLTKVNFMNMMGQLNDAIPI